MLIFPALFVFSSKLKSTQNLPSILKWAGIVAPLFVFGFWVRHGLLWVYAVSPLETPQASLVGTFGFADSLVTLLVAAVVCTVACLAFWVKKRLNIWLAGTAITLVGVYFMIYDLVSVWDPIYRAFLPLTDFWMVTLLILGIAILVDSRSIA